MKRIGRVLKIAVLTVAITAGGGTAYLFVRRPGMTPPPEMHAEATPQRLARGKYLFNLADCDGCHSERDFSHFGGPVVQGRRGVGTIFPAAMGLPGLVAPANITPDLETGIGTWTDGEKIRAIREGVDRDGRALFPMMPYENFRHMSDEDVLSLVAYLDSLTPVKHRVPQTRLDFPVSVLIKGAPRPARGTAAPDRHDSLKYGEYLVRLAGCMECHTDSLSGGRMFRMAPSIVVVSANISPDLQTGIGRWSEQDFLDRIYQYQDYAQHGSPKVGPQSFTLMPWLNFSQLPPEDLKAIYAYLRSRPPVYRAIETHPGWDPEPVKRAALERR
jgi:hypothetical protein